MLNTVAAADWQIEAKNTHLTSSESHFVEDEKNVLILQISNWIHIKLLNDMSLTTPSLNYQDLLDVQISDFSSLTGFLKYIFTGTWRFFLQLRQCFIYNLFYRPFQSFDVWMWNGGPRRELAPLFETLMATFHQWMERLQACTDGHGGYVEYRSIVFSEFLLQSNANWDAKGWVEHLAVNLESAVLFRQFHERCRS
jgi:hypothetical protein